MTDLVIIHPGAAHGIYGSDLATSLVAVEQPLWCRLIAGYILDRGFTVEIIDAEAMNWSPKQAAELAVALKPKLICLAVFGHQPSASTQQMDGASKTAIAIQELTSLIPIIMVGGHVAALPEQTLREEAVDYTCNGEGPITILELLNNMGSFPAEPFSVWSSIPGLVWRRQTGPDDTEIVSNTPAPLIEDMRQLHGNVWNLLPMSRYRSHNWQSFGNLHARQPYASIYTSLGCPYKCSFCCINAPFKSNRYRMRNPRDVVDEIVYLRTVYGVRTFKVIDEMFILNSNHYTAIAEGLIASGYANDLNLWAYSRIDTVKPETLKMLRQAGFRWLALGIESGSKYVRDGAQKRLKNDDIKSVVRAIQAEDIHVIGNYIFGLPDDNFGSMQETLDLALDLRCEFANFYSAMAYPGSPLYSEALSKGWGLPESWAGYSQHNSSCRPLDTLHIPAADVLRFRDYAFNRYFTDPDYLAMVRGKFGEQTYDHVKSMTTFKLKRKLLPETMVA